MKGRSTVVLAHGVRSHLVFSAFLLGAAVLAAHLFFLQFNPRLRDYYIDKVEERWHSYECPQGRRGNILYRDGTLLAGSRKIAKVLIEPTLIRDITNVCETLAPELGMPVDKVRDKITTYKGRTLELASGVELATALKIDRAGMSGVFTRFYYERTYPHGKLCAPATVGYAGKEPVHRLGLERTCDALLTGQDGKTVFRRDAFRHKLPGSVMQEQPRIDGQDITTTLHPAIQAICEIELEEAMAQNKSKWGCVLVMDPSNGEILGAATNPTFNPNDYVRGNLGDESNILVHRVIEPGSTVKPILAAYAIDRGWLDTDERYVCNRQLMVGKYRVREAELSHLLGGNDGVCIDRILISSSNIGMAQIAMHLGQERVEQAYEAMGYFGRTGVELPAESRGIRPYSLKKNKDDKGHWPRITLANTGFGQGLAVTPLQIAASYCILANGGYRVRPTLLRNSEPDTAEAPIAGESIPEGEVLMASLGVAADSREARLLEAAQTSAGSYDSGRVQVLRPETCKLVTSYLEQVVLDGTGKTAKLKRFTAAGKTGTAQVPSPKGGYASGVYTSSFVGYFPANDPQYVMLVMFNHPRGSYYGGTVAAPVFKKVGDRISYIDQVSAAGQPDADR
jgi:cell division protein FtsI/penicillin-binding protein 2